MRIPCARFQCTFRATGRVAHSWQKRYFPNGQTLFMTEPLCDVHQVDLCLDMQAEGVQAFAVPLDHEQRMERARALRKELGGYDA